MLPYTFQPSCSQSTSHCSNLNVFWYSTFRPVYKVKEIVLTTEIHACFVAVYTHNEKVHAVGECVWAHYLSATEKAGRGGAPPLSVEQQQEVWVQYSALQVALQVNSFPQTLCCALTTLSSSKLC